MERIEPALVALVPEWLRCSGSVTGGGSTAHHFASSWDVSSSTLSVRNKAFMSINDKDSPRSSFLDRSGSSNSRRSSSSNGSSKHPYSSFNRSHRDKTRDREKERHYTIECLQQPTKNVSVGRLYVAIAKKIANAT